MNRDEKCARLWTWLRGLYGKGLVVEFGDTMPAPWKAAVGDLTQDELRRGCLALQESGSKFPPKLPEFLAMCREPKTEPAHRPLPPPPKAKGVTAEGEAAIAHCKELAARAVSTHGNDIRAALASLAGQENHEAHAIRRMVAGFQRRREELGCEGER